MRPMPVIGPSQSATAKRGEVEVLGDLGPAASAAALAAAVLVRGPALLAEVGRPDDVAAGSHGAVDARDHRALGRGGDLQRVEPLAGDPLRRRHRGDEPGVDRGAGDRADGAADRRGRDAEDRAADRPADRGAGGGEDDRGHGSDCLRWSHLRTTSRHAARWRCSVREQEGVGDAPAPGRVERRLDDAAALVGVDEAVGRGKDAAVLGRRRRCASGTGSAHRARARSTAARASPRGPPRRAARACRSRPSRGCRAGSPSARVRRDRARPRGRGRGSRSRRRGGSPGRGRACRARRAAAMTHAGSAAHKHLSGVGVAAVG